jgi:hypothetical protein
MRGKINVGHNGTGIFRLGGGPPIAGGDVGIPGILHEFSRVSRGVSIHAPPSGKGGALRFLTEVSA